MDVDTEVVPSPAKKSSALACIWFHVSNMFRESSKHSTETHHATVVVVIHFDMRNDPSPRNKSMILMQLEMVFNTYDRYCDIV